MACTADYPAVPQHWDTSVVPVAGVVVNRAESGATRARSLYDAVSYDIVVIHDLITTAQRASILAFYAANAGNTFGFQAAEDATIYTVIFTNEPQSTPIAPNVWRVTTQLQGVKCA